MQPFGKSDWQFLEWLNMELPYELAIPLLGIYSRELKHVATKNLYTNVHNSIIHNSQKVEITQMLVN